MELILPKMIHEMMSPNAREIQIHGEMADEGIALLLSYTMQDPKGCVLMFGAAIEMFVF
jgi:hypothetical protein